MLIFFKRPSKASRCSGDKSLGALTDIGALPEKDEVAAEVCADTGIEETEVETTVSGLKASIEEALIWMISESSLFFLLEVSVSLNCCLERFTAETEVEVEEPTAATGVVVEAAEFNEASTLGFVVPAEFPLFTNEEFCTEEVTGAIWTGEATAAATGEGTGGGGIEADAAAADDLGDVWGEDFGVDLGDCLGAGAFEDLKVAHLLFAPSCRTPGFSKRKQSSQFFVVFLLSSLLLLSSCLLFVHYHSLPHLPSSIQFLLADAQSNWRRFYCCYD